MATACCSNRDGQVAELLRPLADTVIAHRRDLDDSCAVAFAGELYSVLAWVSGLDSAATVAARQLAAGTPECRDIHDGLIVLRRPGPGEPG